MLRKKEKGFTLIELVIVIVIIGILAIIAVPIYRKYVASSIVSEGKTLVGAVATAEKVWWSEHNTYLAVAPTGNDTDLGIDCRNNRYYTQFSVTDVANVGDTATMTINAIGQGDAAIYPVSLTVTANVSQATPVVGGGLGL